MIDSLGAMFSGNAVIGAIVNFLSLNQRYNDFTLGVIHYDNVIFFLSIQALFVFLTVRVLVARDGAERRNIQMKKNFSEETPSRRS